MEYKNLPIRCATPDDAAIIAEHRARMFQDMNRLDAGHAASLIEQLQPALRVMLASGEYVSLFVLGEGGAVIAGAGVQMRTLLPRPETAVMREALVVNVYVQPTHRGHGLARRLMAAILGWCRKQGIERVALHPSSMGLSLYQSLGFTPSNELILDLTHWNTFGGTKQDSG